MVSETVSTPLPSLVTVTVKSDDVIGRAKTYEAIVKGESMPTPGLPESFNVLMHELKGLGLDIRLEE